MLISKALVKQTRRKWTKVKTTLRNLNLLTNFGSVAKWIRKLVVEFTQVAKSRNYSFAYMRMTCDQIVSWPNVEHVTSTCAG